MSYGNLRSEMRTRTSAARVPDGERSRGRPCDMTEAQDQRDEAHRAGVSVECEENGSPAASRNFLGRDLVLGKAAVKLLGTISVSDT